MCSSSGRVNRASVQVNERVNMIVGMPDKTYLAEGVVSDVVSVCRGQVDSSDRGKCGTETVARHQYSINSRFCVAAVVVVVIVGVVVVE
jgi:hypothetical protein